MSRFLIKGGCVLSMDSRVGNHRDHDVLLDDGIIAEIAPDIRARGAEEIDATNAIVMSGFVDAHAHTAESLVTNAADSQSADGAYAATLIGLLTAAEAGITSVVDWCEITDPALIAAGMRAHADSGLRTVFVAAGMDAALAARGAASPRTTVAVTPHTPDEWEQARIAGLAIHVHTTAGSLPSREQLGPDVTLTHGDGLTDTDLDAIAQASASVVLTPASDMAGGAVPFAIQRLIDRGIRPALGTGSPRTASGDLFSQMRAAISLQHAMYFDLKLAGKAGLPKLMTTRDVIGYATASGATAAGLGTVAGALAVGRPADIVILRIDRPNVMPVNDPVGAVVWGMDTSNVDTVLVAGKHVVRDGALTHDPIRIRTLVAASAATEPAGEVA